MRVEWSRRSFALRAAGWALALGVAAQASAAAATVDAACAPALRLIREHLALPGSASYETVLSQFRSDGKVLVVSVPDPAAAQVGYTIDQQIEALNRAMNEQGYLPDRSDLPWNQDEKRSGIGTILFRGAAPPLVAVFLVTESPTTGVDPDALSAALACASSMTSDDTVRVVAPTYSGGAASVARAAERWPKDEKRLHIVSGTITVRGAAQTIREKVPSFEALSIPIEAQLGAVRSLLEREGILSASFPVLMETSTAFGKEVEGWERIPYPLHIAHARVESDKARRTSNGVGKEDILADRLRGALRVPLAPAKPRDLPAVSSPENAAVVADIMVREQLSRLARTQARAIGIVGTDAYDRIYLAQLVREHLPDAQLFIVGRDVLYLHPAVAPELVGTLVITADSHDELSSFVAAGLHDAVRRQVCALSGDCGCDDLFSTQMRIFAVGRRHLHLLRSVAVAPDHSDIAEFQRGPTETSGASVDAPSAPPLVRFGAGAVPSGVAVLFAVLLGLFARSAQQAGGWMGDARKIFERWTRRSASLDRFSNESRWLGALACGVPAFHLFLALALVGEYPWRGAPSVGLFSAALGASLGLVLLTLGSLRACGRFGILAAAAVSVVASACVVRQASDLSDGERAASLSSGLSPLVPLALTGIALCALLFEQARREAIRASFSNVTAWARGAPWEGAVARVGSHLGVGPSKAPVVLRIVFSFAVPAGLAWLSGCWPLATMEPWYFDALIAASLLLLAGLITNAWLLIFQLWYSLRPLLRALAASTFRDGFDAIPKELSRTLGLRVYMRPLDVNQLAPHVRLLGRLAGRGLPVAAEAGAAAANLQLQQAGVHADLPGFRSGVSRDLSNAAGAVVVALPGLSLLDRPLAQQFVALEVTRFISVVFFAVRSLAIAATASVVLFFVAVSSYPFRPGQPLVWGALLGFATGATVILTVLFQSNRNELLSRITESTPNRVNFDREFLLPLLTYAVVPLLVILSRFPGLDRTVQSILPWVR